MAVTVIIPTVGRPALLAGALASIAACRTQPDEVIVVDQSEGDATSAVAGAGGARRLRSSGRGIALAMNEGLASAAHDVVLVTHDDCSVSEDWVDVAQALAAEDPACIFTGRVLPEGDPEHVPSTKTDPDPEDFTGTVRCEVLYPANMVVPRSRLLAMGGFDTRFVRAAEDSDLCFRWLRSGSPLRYEPALTVVHRDWRTADELRDLYTRYSREQGRFYAKHLRLRDKAILPFLLADLRHVGGALRDASLDAGRGRRPRLSPASSGVVRGLLPGLVQGIIRDPRCAPAAHQEVG